MSSKIKLALVGCGGISQNHVEGYKALKVGGCDEFEVVACCDLKGENAQKASAVIAGFQGTTPKVFKAPAELVQSRIADAVDICVPHCFHHSTAIQCLDGGLHVLLEKPLGITARASRRIIDAAERNKRVVATAENVRRDLPARACTWALRDAKLMGDMISGAVHGVSSTAINIEDPAWRWRGVKLLTGGGMIFDSGAHFADMMLVLFGEPDEVYARTRTFDRREVNDIPRLGKANLDVEDNWNVVITFKSGVQVNWSFANMVQPLQNNSAIYYGTKGSIRDLGWPFHPFQGGGEMTLKSGTVLSSEQIQTKYLMSLKAGEKERLFPYGVTDGFGIEVWDFVNAIATNCAPEMDGWAGLKAKALCLSCYESATLGQAVKYNDVLEGKLETYQQPINKFWEI
jgi:UDP-N-acetyl-2-amino-2-deoxyglucuronate dehydrogenase